MAILSVGLYLDERLSAMRAGHVVSGRRRGSHGAYTVAYTTE
jgi:hypothetical protein